MNRVRQKTQNPKQLLRLFIIISVVAFILITGITGFGIHTISRNANISEAEHDSVILSNVFLEHEGNKLLSIINPSSPLKQSPSKKIIDTEFYSIQAGTFSLKSGALQKYDELSKTLKKSQKNSFLRVEKIGKYYTVRIGAFTDKNEAQSESKSLSDILNKPIIVRSTIKQDRLIKSNISYFPQPTSDDIEETDLTETEEFREFDKNIRSILSLMNIIKIKIFSTDGTIVYSTDKSIINKDDSKNPRLIDALSGNINSLFKRKDEMRDVVGEKINKLDVVETYLPIKNSKNEIVGAFEVYLDITRYRVDMRSRLFKSVTLISVVLLAVFSIFILLMRTGTDELSSVQERLLELSSTDSLTGLFNRRHIFNQLEKEFKQLHSDKQNKDDNDSVGCIMADIDYFKSINDQFGHHIGDHILQSVSKRILETLRPYDIAGRYGGEEFLIMLPNTSLKDTQRAAERIWENIRSKKFGSIEGEHQITLSIGFSCLTNFDSSVEDAIRRADAGLYKAKETGRDKVCWNASVEV